MTIELVIKILRALFPDLTIMQVVNMIEQRLRGRLTQQELSQFLALKAEAFRRS